MKKFIVARIALKVETKRNCCRYCDKPENRKLIIKNNENHGLSLQERSKLLIK